MIQSLATAAFFFLPAAVGNMAPVFAKKINILNIPVDAGKKVGGIRLFGANKTWRGLIAGAVAGIIVALLQLLLLDNFTALESYIEIDYTEFNIYWLGFLQGFGALVGDMVESFFKRRVGVKSGQSWFPFDQIDYILGGVLLTLPIVQLDWLHYLSILIVYFVCHLVVSYIGYLVGLKDEPI